jgi:hypothetical protein
LLSGDFNSEVVFKTENDLRTDRLLFPKTDRLATASEGLLVAMAGYPGILANGKYTDLNEPLFVGINWVFYFLVFEGVAALKRKFGANASRTTA